MASSKQIGTVLVIVPSTKPSIFFRVDRDRWREIAFVESWRERLREREMEREVDLGGEMAVMVQRGATTLRTSHLSS